MGLCVPEVIDLRFISNFQAKLFLKTAPGIAAFPHSNCTPGKRLWRCEAQQRSARERATAIFFYFFEKIRLRRRLIPGKPKSGYMLITFLQPFFW
jgi:hypothetical protein